MHNSARIGVIGILTTAVALGGFAVAATVGLAPDIQPHGASQRRPTQEQTDQLVEVMDLRPGMILADVGAGRGGWAMALARHVGPSGHVYATDIDPERLDDTRRLMDRADVGNVTPTLGSATETGLPDECCDAILIRAAYHEFTDPEPMLAGLRRALRPGGTLTIIEYPGDNQHEIEAEQVVEEFSAAGFTLLRRVEEWDERDQYCLLFTH